MAIEELFSSHVVLVDSRDDHADDSLLWPEERAALGEVVPGRWWDWVTGRRCARRAFTVLGVDPAPVLRRPKREPRWQPEVVGAITHTAGYAAAAVARAGDVRSIGLDAEPDQPLPDGVLRRIARDEELDWVASGVSGVANADRLLFSVKESIYKAWFPVAERWLGFDEASVEVDQAGGLFRAEILVDGPLSSVTGRYTSVGGIVVTAIEVPG
ncbi:MAG: 4'-phosphopantetheinyl transferase superfamily protein [Actinomycetota bacterium]